MFTRNYKRFKYISVYHVLRYQTGCRWKPWCCWACKENSCYFWKWVFHSTSGLFETKHGHENLYCVRIILYRFSHVILSNVNVEIEENVACRTIIFALTWSTRWSDKDTALLIEENGHGVWDKCLWYIVYLRLASTAALVTYRPLIPVTSRLFAINKSLSTHSKPYPHDAAGTLLQIEAD